MKKIFIIVLMVGVIATGSLFAVKVSAQTDNSYTVLAPLPGTTDPCAYGPGMPTTCKTTLEKYIPGLFKLAIGLSAVAAVLMIVIGGFEYITTDAIQGKSAGRERIKNAIWGLVLVITAWLILYTINPNLMNINLNIDAATTTSPPGATGTLSSSSDWVNLNTDQIAQSKATRTTLLSEGITAYRDPCTTQGVSTGCVNLNNLKPTTISGVEALSAASGCGPKNSCINITGGTEGGHTGGPSHANGSALDMEPNPQLDAYITNPKNPETAGGRTITLPNGQTIVVLYESATTKGSTGAHWHVTFK